jgi:hypothetical protein
MNSEIDKACVHGTVWAQRLSHAAVLLAALLIVTAYASGIVQLA